MVLAWAVGLGIMTWRTAQIYHKPPVPGRILGASMVYVLLALLAEYEPAKRAALLAAWGFNVAVLLKLPPAAFTTAAFATAGESGSAAGEGSGGPAKQSNLRQGRTA